MGEGQPGEALRRGLRLGVDELQLVAGAKPECRAGLGADANPVDTGRGRAGAVGLDRDLEAAGVQGGDQGGVQLQQGLAPGADTVGAAPGGGLGGPGGEDAVGQ